MAKAKDELKLLQTVICDDIRREDNGKFMLIGVFADTIFMNILPAEIALSSWMMFELNIKGKTTLEIEIMGNALQEASKIVFEIADEKLFGKKQSLPFVGKFALKIKGEGGFTMSYKKKGDESWQLAHTVEVRKNLTPTSR
jgi:hypothetical protein